MSAYAVTAQFYDAVADTQHAAVNLEIAKALKGLKTAGDPVIDIGAGTGLTTSAIARALPKAEILAVEPDPAMRAALMTRICSDPNLRRRISILPMPLLSAPLPPVISAAIASASLVHFDTQQRQELWAFLSNRLSPAGRAIIEIQCPLSVDISETRVATETVGRATYECWASAQRVDADRQRWLLHYVTRFNGVEIDRQSTDYLCNVTSHEQVLAEAGAFGLTGSSQGSLVVLYKEGMAKGWKALWRMCRGAT